MKQFGVYGALAVTTLLLAACTTTRQMADTGFRPPQGSYRLLVMQPDISVGTLTAGGIVEPNEEWTNQSRDNIVKAIVADQSGHGGDTHVLTAKGEAGVDPAALADLINLHKAVGTSIRLHKYVPGQDLPTKKDRFDWSLGDEAVAFGTTTHYDYALFLHAQDSFESGGRAALQVAGTLACLIGVCIVPMGGQQIAFASLVDLKTGKVVWFNFLSSGVGDIRTPDGAQKMVSSLLGSMKSNQPAAGRGRT